MRIKKNVVRKEDIGTEYTFWSRDGSSCGVAGAARAARTKREKRLRVASVCLLLGEGPR